MTPTTLEEFADIYNHWLPRVGSNEILLAEDTLAGALKVIESQSTILETAAASAGNVA